MVCFTGNGGLNNAHIIIGANAKLRICGSHTNVGHIQIAAVPDRGEPDSGVLDYRDVFLVLEELDYDGFIGAEYRPRKGTAEGLGWLNEVKSWLS